MGDTLCTSISSPRNPSTIYWYELAPFYISINFFHLKKNLHNPTLIVNLPFIANDSPMMMMIATLMNDNLHWLLSVSLRFQQHQRPMLKSIVRVHFLGSSLSLRLSMQPNQASSQSKCANTATESQGFQSLLYLYDDGRRRRQRWHKRTELTALAHTTPHKHVEIWIRHETDEQEMGKTRAEEPV